MMNNLPTTVRPHSFSIPEFLAGRTVVGYCHTSLAGLIADHMSY
jgi:hypothetical protein